jgi:hypothetical protein
MMGWPGSSRETEDKMKLTEGQKKERAKARELKKRLVTIEQEKSQKRVKRIAIVIEWKKSRIWGANPHGTAKVEFADGSFAFSDGFTCSGCGYDKESTVLAKIFDKFLRYKLWILKDDKEAIGKKPYGIYIRDGIDGGAPWVMYDDGIGESCYPDISAWIGGEWRRVASGKMFSAYEYVDKLTIY